MKNYILPENVAQAILQYLGTQPYVQVTNLIQALGTLSEVPAAGPDAVAIAQSLAEIKKMPAKKPAKAEPKGGK